MHLVKALDGRGAVAGLDSLPPFPEVARQLLAMAADDRTSMQQIARLVRSDVVFAGEVLRLANSAILGLRYEVTSILHAVSVLGMERLRSLVLTVGLRDLLRETRNSGTMKLCWRHNLACALTAEWAADSCLLDKAQAYTAGLMHGLGHFALAAAQPAEWRLVMTQSTPETILQIEREKLGIDHIEAAAWLVLRWDLPDVFLDICRCDHANGEIDPTGIAGLADLACEAAKMLGFPVARTEAAWEPDRLLERLPEETAARLAPRMEELHEVVPYKINLFEMYFLG